MATEADVEPPIDPNDASNAVVAGILIGAGLGLGMAALFGIGAGDVMWGAIGGVSLLAGFAALGYVTEGYDGW